MTAQIATIAPYPSGQAVHAPDRGVDTPETSQGHTGPDPLAVVARSGHKVKLASGEWVTAPELRRRKRARWTPLHRLHIRVTAEELAEIDRLVKSTGMSRSELGGVAVRTWLEDFR